MLNKPLGQQSVNQEMKVGKGQSMEKKKENIESGRGTEEVRVPNTTNTFTYVWKYNAIHNFI